MGHGTKGNAYLIIFNNDNFSYSKEEMTLNVGGRKYLVFRETICRFPTTRLGKISRTRNVDDIREHCDGLITDGGHMEIFFSRAWLCFDQILNFHRAGNLHFDSEICALVYKTELGTKLGLKKV